MIDKYMYSIAFKEFKENQIRDLLIKTIEKDINKYNFLGLIFSGVYLTKTLRIRGTQNFTFFNLEVDNWCFRIDLDYYIPFPIFDYWPKTNFNKLSILQAAKQIKNEFSKTSFNENEKELDFKELAMYYRNFICKSMSLSEITVKFTKYEISSFGVKPIRRDRFTSFFKYLFKRDKLLAYKFILYQEEKPRLVQLLSLDGL